MKPPSKASKPSSGPWRCPKCGREFSHETAYHSCGNYTVEGHLEGKNPVAVALFNTLVNIVTNLGGGAVTLSPVKTQIGFKAGASATFMAVAVSGKQLHGYLFLPRSVTIPAFRKVTAVSSRRHIHHFRIVDPATISGAFSECLKEAIEAAQGKVAVVEPSDSGEAAIGEQINALYRRDRSLAQVVRPGLLV